MTFADSITGFAKSLENLDPCLRTVMDVLPSGVVYLNVYVKDREFVMEYSPSHVGFGVDEILEGEGFMSGYYNWFTDFPSAADKLTILVKDSLTKSIDNRRRVRNLKTGKIECEKEEE